MMIGFKSVRLWMASALALLMVGGLVMLPVEASAHSRNYRRSQSNVRFYNTPLLSNNPYRIVRINRYVRPCKVNNNRYNARRYYNNQNARYVTPYRRSNMVVSSGFGNYFPVATRYGF